MKTNYGKITHIGTEAEILGAHRDRVKDLITTLASACYFGTRSYIGCLCRTLVQKAEDKTIEPISTVLMFAFDDTSMRLNTTLFESQKKNVDHADADQWRQIHDDHARSKANGKRVKTEKDTQMVKVVQSDLALAITFRGDEGDLTERE